MMFRLATLTCLVVASGGVAHADQKRPTSVADKLFEEGRDLLEAWGRLQSARESLTDTIRRAESVDQPAFVKAAQNRIDGFAAQIPVLVVRVTGDVNGLNIVLRREGYADQTIAPQQAVPLDPSGWVTGAAPPIVEVSASGFRTYTSAPVELALGQRSSLDVPALVPLDSSADKIVVLPRTSVATSGWTGRRKLGLGLGAGGAVLLGTSLALNLSFRSSGSAADCNAECANDANQKMKVIGTPIFGAGLALAALGTYLFVTGDAPVTPIVDDEQVGIAWVGDF